MVKAKWNLPELPKQKAVYKWKCDHAVFVQQGYQRQDGTEAPARDWIAYALSQADIADIFHTEYVRANGNMLRAWIATAERLDGEFRAAIEAEVYQWDRETVRGDGSVASSPRDSVDTGELRESQELSFE
jgi:hypothetical protein